MNPTALICLLVIVTGLLAACAILLDHRDRARKQRDYYIDLATFLLRERYGEGRGRRYAAEHLCRSGVHGDPTWKPIRESRK